MAQQCLKVGQEQMDSFYRYASKSQILTKFNFPSLDLKQNTAFQKLRPKQQKTVNEEVEKRLWQKSLKNADKVWTMLATFICKMYHIDQTQWLLKNRKNPAIPHKQHELNLIKLKKFIDDFVATRHVEARRKAYCGPRTKFRTVLDFWEKTVKGQRKAGGVLADYMQSQNDEVALLRQRNRDLRFMAGASPRESRRDIVMNPDMLEKYMPSGFGPLEAMSPQPSRTFDYSLGNGSRVGAPGLSL